MTTSYDTDVIAWANEQAELIRAGQIDKLDFAHIADEIEDVGKSEQRELANRMSMLLMHLLKWEFQPSHRSNSSASTIQAQRKSIAWRLAKTPSLQKSLVEIDWLDDAWLDARNEATKETRIEFDKFPEICSWSMQQILEDGWLPMEMEPNS